MPVGGLDKSNGLRGWRCLCEFYIKLLGCVIANWLMLLRCGQLGGVSALKMFRVMRNRMADFFCSFCRGEPMSSSNRGGFNENTNPTPEKKNSVNEANPYEKICYDLS
ncbi:hypothetical protein FACS1894170_03340 [Planctomycetales bacterium]|nr:hypothetical protein FACS1894170_03340 [Planctomycetales bacterium]